MKKVLLTILDGWGINPEPTHNAIAQANPTFWNELLEQYPSTVLHAREESVGLSPGYLSGSQVGHSTISAGRIILQSGAKIDKAIEIDDFSTSQVFISLQNHLQSFSSTLHLVGMLSNGGVHSHLNHLIALIRWAKKQRLDSVALHLLLDGRDMAPKSALELLKQLEPHLSENIKISTISGRLFGMDRNENWDRTIQSYETMTNISEPQAISPGEYIEKNYQENISDEFIAPANFSDQVVKDGDGMIFFNFRADRMRQITRLFAGKAPGAVQNTGQTKSDLFLASMTEYSDHLPEIHVLFAQEIPKNTLGEWLSKQGLKQFRITETEKFAHLTFFFNGGREIVFEGESRLMIPSLRVRDFASTPKMSLPEITKSLVRALEDEAYDFIVCNFANGDMVGHSGNMQAAVEAVQAVDTALSQVIPKAKEKNYTTIITADHGNIEHMKTDGEPHTAHTYNDVPLVIIDKDLKLSNNGYLHQVAPTVLEIMGLKKPEEMTSQSLLEK